MKRSKAFSPTNRGVKLGGGGHGEKSVLRRARERFEDERLGTHLQPRQEEKKHVVLDKIFCQLHASKQASHFKSCMKCLVRGDARREKKRRGQKKSPGRKSAVTYPKQFFPPAGFGFNGVQPSASPSSPLRRADHVTAPIRLFLSYWELSCSLTGGGAPVSPRARVHTNSPARTHRHVLFRPLRPQPTYICTYVCMWDVIWVSLIKPLKSRSLFSH